MHIYPNKENGYVHVFICDTCRRVAASIGDENQSLLAARQMAKEEGWTWIHPNWGLRCPDCLNKVDTVSATNIER